MSGVWEVDIKMSWSRWVVGAELGIGPVAYGCEPFVDDFDFFLNSRDKTKHVHVNELWISQPAEQLKLLKVLLH